MKKRTWHVASSAECNDCGWISTNDRNAQAVGAKHAKHYNHFVRVETVLVSYYNYPEGTFRSSVTTPSSLAKSVRDTGGRSPVHRREVPGSKPGVGGANPPSGSNSQSSNRRMRK